MEGYFLYDILDTQATVQYSYDAEEDDELDLKKGDVIQVLAKGEDGRWSGVNRGRTGWFPGTCVKEMEQPSFTSESKGMCPYCLGFLCSQRPYSVIHKRKTYVAITFQSNIIDMVV